VKASHQLRGIENENRVAQYLQLQGICILGRRIKISGVEVDILARSRQNVWLVVEVKSLSSEEWIGLRVKSSQTVRLRRATQALASGWWLPGLGGECREVELWLALVDLNKRVQIFTDF
jgi:Holliday junction resolvase-like predicted endonuclease